MKRRRRGLGSSESEHQARAAHAHTRVLVSADQSRRYAESGRCDAALQSLKSAAEKRGEVVAHREAGGRLARDVSETALLRAESVFRKHCLR